jgi:hypothetical protein
MPKLGKLNLLILVVTKRLVSFQHTVSTKKWEGSTCTVPCSVKNSALPLPVVPTNHKPLPHHQATLTFNLVQSQYTKHRNYAAKQSCFIPFRVSYPLNSFIQPHLLFMQE